METLIKNDDTNKNVRPEGSNNSDVLGKEELGTQMYCNPLYHCFP